ncbi:two-component system LytT family sensor kinase [Actinomadura pelletieri DSM 43383]|uniref:histidine kinase n=1 Tax=Actinomadura pelletieri DSM 43383 TaxID=1120940 RepID=A0A495QNQ7_9ACTN|nr:histidine kinase [Actinomadura pelletieri]RKS74615.1 two-component system LytT family sensor kinase [Actinomadura pelletieri DSM 43383]
MVLPSVAAVVGCATTACAAAGAWALRRRLGLPRDLRRDLPRGFPRPRGLLRGLPRGRARGLPRRAPGDAAEKATFAALHLIARASPPLRGGLTEDSARTAARRLRPLLGAEAVALVGVLPPEEGFDAPGVPGDGESGHVPAMPRLLAWDGAGRGAHAPRAVRDALPVLASGRPRVVAPELLGCRDPRCPVQVAMVAPLTVEGHVEGAMTVYWRTPSTARVRAVGEAARLVTGQLELAGLDDTRLRLAEAELRALRAQISPHFVYNSLTTIASFVRTDPERARALLLDFADFARYSFRNPRDFTTLADELRSIDRYLLLERARFGDRLKVRVEIAPEVLPVAVPFLALQPLVENAVRHGMADAGGVFHISIVARDSGAEAAISVEDDGVGMDPERLREILSAPLGRPGPVGWGSVAARARRGDCGAGIGLANVDERMRQVYGDEYGLTVETALGAGTKVSLRVPKYRPGVFPD